MFYFNKLIILTVLMTAVLAKNVYSDTVGRCSILSKCSTIEEIVWATDDRQCYLYRNPCIFGNEMCKRREKKEEELKIVTKEECKEKCRDFCTEEYFPVCAEYNNALETFSNKCEFTRISCQNDKSYIFLHNGKCDQAAAA